MTKTNNDVSEHDSNGNEQIDPIELKCEHCGKKLVAESFEDYDRRLARHILDEHKDVASQQAIIVSREKLENPRSRESGKNRMNET